MKCNHIWSAHLRIHHKFLLCASYLKDLATLFFSFLLLRCSFQLNLGTKNRRPAKRIDVLAAFQFYHKGQEDIQELEDNSMSPCHSNSLLKALTIKVFSSQWYLYEAKLFYVYEEHLEYGRAYNFWVMASHIQVSQSCRSIDL